MDREFLEELQKIIHIEVEGSVKAAVKEEVERSVKAAVKEEVERSVKAAVKEEVERSVKAAVKEEVEHSFRAVEKSLKEEVERSFKAAEKSLRTEIGRAVREETSPLKDSIEAMRTQVEENTQILRALNEKTDFFGARQEAMSKDVTGIRADISDIGESICVLEEITARNWGQIAKLKKA